MPKHNICGELALAMLCPRAVVELKRLTEEQDGRTTEAQWKNRRRASKAATEACWRWVEAVTQRGWTRRQITAGLPDGWRLVPHRYGGFVAEKVRASERTADGRTGAAQY